MLNFRSAGAVALGFALLGSAGCEDEITEPVIDGTIAETAAASPQLSTLVAALEAAGLVGTLDGAGPFTVFAPVNSAFDALGADVIASLLADGNADVLTRVLTFHVVAGAAVASGDLSDGQTFTTVEGGQLTIGIAGGAVTVNGANVVTADIEGTNGIVHLIDAVLVPGLDIYEKAALTSGTTTLASAVLAGDLAATLQSAGPFTVFAPIDAAFEALGTNRLDVVLDPANQALLQKILTYHVIEGDLRAADLTDGATVATVEGSEVTIDLSDPMDPKVNGASIIATDIEVENGVIHLIDGVLTENLDIIDVATIEGFSTLVALVEQQGLTATLRSDNGGAGFTVFAPTNDAFAALGSVPTGQALTDVLLYHGVGAKVFSTDLSDGQVVTTLESNGATFTVEIGAGVTIMDGGGNVANVVLTDVRASNGVIHVLDAVIVPAP